MIKASKTAQRLELGAPTLENQGAGLALSGRGERTVPAPPPERSAEVRGRPAPLGRWSWARAFEAAICADAAHGPLTALI